MNRKRYKSLVVAVAAWIGFAAVPGISFAEPAASVDDVAETVKDDAEPVATTDDAAETVKKDAEPVATTDDAAETVKKDAEPAAQTPWWARDDISTTETEGDAEAKSDADGNAAEEKPPQIDGPWWMRSEDEMSARPADEQGNETGTEEKKDFAPEPINWETAKDIAVYSPERAQQWEETRPDEAEVVSSIKDFDGLTVVEVVFDGATKETYGTARSAINMRAGSVFSTEKLEADRNAIFNTGYFYDLYPSFEKVPEGVIVTYHVLENPVLKDIIITGNTVESTEKLKDAFTIRTGEILNSTSLHNDMESLLEEYKKDGYILAKVTDMNIDRDGVLTLKLSEGILEGYKVKGNKKTKDYVILREMRQKTGEPFNAKLARRSMQRVYNLGFFEDVNIKMNPGVEPNAVEMEVDVKEKRTGTFGVGAGYSSEDGIIGMVSISDTNFRGRGDAVRVTYEMSGDDEDAHGFTFSYRHPWIDKKETAGTIRIYNRTYEYDDYDTHGHLKEEYMRKYSGGELTLSRPVSEYSTNFITLRHRKDKYVRHVSNGNMGDRSNNYDWKRNNFGTTRSITFEHVTDTRDNVYNPMSGGRVSLSGEFAGFGGDFDFKKFTIDDQRYIKLGHVQVLALRAQYGIGTGKISEFNQYRLGGQDSLRGYRDDQFRGDRVFSGTIEYRFPLVSKVQAAIFTDWGGTWDNGIAPKNMHGSVGVGIGLETPIGPLRLDYGKGSQGGRVHFNVGGTF